MFSIFSLPGDCQASLLAMKRVVLVSSVSTMRRLFARGRAGLGEIDDGVEQAGLDLGGAPGKFDGDVDAAARRSSCG